VVRLRATMTFQNVRAPVTIGMKRTTFARSEFWSFCHEREIEHSDLAALDNVLVCERLDRLCRDSGLGYPWVPQPRNYNRDKAAATARSGQVDVEVTPAMALEGGRTIETYGRVLDPSSLAEKVYIAMVHAAEPDVLARLSESVKPQGRRPGAE
jgi:hypothetical protein